MAKTTRQTLIQVHVESVLCGVFPNKRNECDVSDGVLVVVI